MPIKGLTDRQRLPRLGKIKTGYVVERENGPSYPKATNYFVVPETVQAVHGAEPKVLEPVIFPIESEDLLTNIYYRLWSNSRGLICRGDGETADRLVDADVLRTDGEPQPANRETQTTARVDVNCPCPLLDKKNGCAPMMMLQFMLPSVPGIGIWQIDTRSYNSIHNVLGSIRAIKAVAGRISMMPLRLSLVPKEVTPEGGRKKTVHVLELNVIGDMGYYGLRTLAASVENGNVSALPEPDDERPEELTSETIENEPEVEEPKAVQDWLNGDGAPPEEEPQEADTAPQLPWQPIAMDAKGFLDACGQLGLTKDDLGGMYPDGFPKVPYEVLLADIKANLHPAPPDD